MSKSATYEWEDGATNDNVDVTEYVAEMGNLYVCEWEGFVGRSSHQERLKGRHLKLMMKSTIVNLLQWVIIYEMK